MPDFYAVLSAVLILVMFTRSSDVIRSALVLAVVWLTWCAYIMETQDYYPWYLGIIIDSAAAMYLVKLPSNRPKAALSGTFCAMVLMNIAYGAIVLTGGSVEQVIYDRMLDSTGWAQLLMIAGWACGNIGGRAVRHWGLWHKNHYPENHKHMDHSQ